MKTRILFSQKSADFGENMQHPSLLPQLVQRLCSQLHALQLLF